MERRLTAILFYDVVGYSISMGRDETSTIEALKANRSVIIAPLAKQHCGRTIQVLGDGGFMEFASAVDAVRFAIAMQKAVAKRNSELPEEQCLVYRIGINIGDVVADDDFIYGDGVNIAARLEGLAQPGGICVHQTVRDQVRGKLDLDFDDLGVQSLKNISHPVHIFGYSPDTAAPKTTPIPSPMDAPCVAVLPFENLSADPEQSYFADGITEDIVTALSKRPALTIISRHSSFQYRGANADTRAIGEGLAARYIVQGSVRKASNRIRVTAHLLDGEANKQIWADKFDRDITDIFAVQDEIAAAISHALAGSDGAIEKSERRRSLLVRETNATAYDLYLRLRECFFKPGDSGFDAAIELLQRAIQQDPGFARAYSALAWLEYLKFKFFYRKSFKDIQDKALELAQKSLTLDPDDYRAHIVVGFIHLHMGKNDLAHAEIQYAYDLNPNDADLHNHMSEVLTYAGRNEEALEFGLQAHRLNPKCPDWYHWTLGSLYYHVRRFENALTEFQKIKTPIAVRRLIAATLAQLGRDNEAAEQARLLLQTNPDFQVTKWAATQPYLDKSGLTLCSEGMLAAGLPA